MSRLRKVLFLGIMFLSFSWIVKAESQDIKFDAAGVGTIVTNGEYNCPSTDDTGKFSFTKKSNGDYEVRYIGGATEEDVKGTAVCESTNILKGNLTVNLNYSLESVTRTIGNFYLNYKGNDKTAVAETTIIARVLKYDEDHPEIVASAEVLEREISNTSYVKYDSGYYVVITEESAKVSAKLVFKYNSVKYTVNYYFVLNEGFDVQAYPGVYGTCDFSGEYWNINGSTYISKDKKVVLPNCKSKSTVYQFVGWTRAVKSTDGSGSGPDLQKVNLCESHVSVSGGQTVEITDQDLAFYACYKGIEGVTLVFNQSFEKYYGVSKSQYGSCEDDGRNNCFIKSSSSISLPTLTSNEKYKFLGWSENGCGTGKEYVSVGEVGKTYCPNFKREVTETEEPEEIVYKVDPSKKFMYERTTEYYGVSGVDFTSCSSSDGSVSTSVSDGLCVLNANSSSAGKTVQITAHGNDGKTYKMELTVVEKASTTYTGGSKTSRTYSIKYDGYVTVKGSGGSSTDNTDDGGSTGKSKIRKVKDSDGEGSATPLDFNFCDKYNVNWISENKSERWVDLFDPYVNGTNLSQGVIDTFGATLFYAEPKCEGAPKEKYNAICIDAGGDPPRNVTFKLHSTYNGTQNPSMDSYSKILYYAAYRMDQSGTPSKDMRAGYTAGLRIATIIEGKDIGCDSAAEGYLVCKAYQSMANYYVSNGNIRVEEINNKAATGYMDELLGAHKYIREHMSTKSFNVAGYPTVTFPDGEYQLDVKEDGVNFEYTESGEEYDGTFDIDLVLPFDNKIDGMEFGLADTPYVINAKGNVKVNDVSLSGEKLTVKIHYTKDDVSKLGDDNAITIKFVAKGILSTAILIPTNNSSLQTVYIYEKSDKEFELGLGLGMDEEENKDHCEDDDCEKTQENCQKLLTKADKKELTTEEESYFLEYCCQFITNEKTSAAFGHYCMDKNKKKTDCELSTYALVCDTEYDEDVETYKVYEAVKGTADDYTCVIDVRRVDRERNGNTSPMTETETKADVKGNNYSLEMFENNQYCSVSCSERWDFELGGFKHFVGVNATKAGSYFQLSEDLYMKQERTCVTTNIDYRRYYNEIYELSNQLIATYNAYLEYTAAYDDAKKQYDHFDDIEHSDENPYKEKYCTKLESYECDCSDGTTGTCYRCAKDGESECDMYSVHTHKDSKVSTYTTNFKDLLGANPITGAGGNVNRTSTNEGNIYETSVQSEVKSASKPSTCPGSTGEEVKAYCETKDGDLAGKTKDEIFDILIAKMSYSSNSEKYTTSDGYRYDFTNQAPALVPYTKWGSGTITSTIDSIKGEISIIENKIQKKVKDMAQCQNFYLSNEAPANYNTKYSKIDSVFYNRGSTDDNIANDNWDIYKYINGKYYAYYNASAPTDSWNVSVDRSNLKIKSSYFPTGAYEYDEYEYMTMINDRNYLVTNNKKNQEYTGKEADGSKGIFNYKDNATGANTDSNDDGEADREGTTIWVNKIDTFAYDADSSPWTNDGDGKSYKGGTSLKTNNTTDAKIGISSESLKTVSNYMNICHIKVNSGSQKYGWSVTDKTETKCLPMDFYYYQASYIKQTITNSSFFKNYGNFYTLNHTNLEVFAKDKTEAVKTGGIGELKDWGARGTSNIFPISYTTRRGLYKYMYAFRDVGNFNTSSSDLGRVMGSDSSIVDYSAHICFYEVYEDLCTCCGYPIDTNVYNSLVNSTDYEQFGFSGNDYLSVKEKKETYKSTFKENSSGGVMNIHPSVVSLYELNDLLNDNWNDSTTILYEGDEYKTSNDKGKQLAESIKEIGENVYNDAPEYSYVLSREALQDIIFENDKNGYQMTYDKLRAVGDYTYFNNEMNGVGDGSDDEPGFVHYASKFLEGKMSSYINNDIYSFKKSTIFTQRNNICIARYDISKVEGTDCRWVDYIGKVSGDGKLKEYRLAFK